MSTGIRRAEYGKEEGVNPYNRHVHFTVSILSILLALAAVLNYGLFEIRQGFTETGGFFIEAIGTADRFWLYGSEGAFTLVPNFLVTGIIVVALGFGLIVFALKYLAVPNGSRILLVFFILLTLFGGGLGHLVIWLPVWGFATRMHSSLGGYEKWVPQKLRMLLGRLWPVLLTAACLSWLIVMELGIFGYFPGVGDPDAVMNVVFAFLLGTTFFLSLAFLGAMARDLQARS